MTVAHWTGRWAFHLQMYTTHIWTSHLNWTKNRFLIIIRKLERWDGPLNWDELISSLKFCSYHLTLIYHMRDILKMFFVRFLFEDLPQFQVIIGPLICHNWYGSVWISWLEAIIQVCQGGYTAWCVRGLRKGSIFYVDVDHSGDLKKYFLQTGFLMLINKAPIDWY